MMQGSSSVPGDWAAKWEGGAESDFLTAVKPLVQDGGGCQKWLNERTVLMSCNHCVLDKALVHRVVVYDSL